MSQSENLWLKFEYLTRGDGSLSGVEAAPDQDSRAAPFATEISLELSGRPQTSEQDGISTALKTSVHNVSTRMRTPFAATFRPKESFYTKVDGTQGIRQSYFVDASDCTSQDTRTGA